MTVSHYSKYTFNEHNMPSEITMQAGWGDGKLTNYIGRTSGGCEPP